MPVFSPAEKARRAGHAKVGLGRGLPPHKPTPETLALAAQRLAQARPLAEIAQAIGISKHTFCKHYKALIDSTQELQDESIKAVFIRRCMGFEKHGRFYPPSEACLVVYAKSRLGFGEVQRLEHSGPNAGPIKVENSTDGFSREDLLEILAEARRRRESDAEPSTPTDD